MRKLHVASLAVAAVLTAGIPVAPAGAARERPAYAGSGPFAAGVTTLDVDGLTVDVWYPAPRRAVKGRERVTYHLTDWVPSGYDDILATIPAGLEPEFRTAAYRDVPGSGKGPFPLVVFAHGAGGFRDASSFLTTHLASWGFVVAAPDLPESSLPVALNARLGVPTAPPGADSDALRATVDAVRTTSRQQHGVLSGTVRQGPVAAVGHSMGVYSSMRLANDGGVAGYVALDGSNRSLPEGYPAVDPPAPPDIPSMSISTGWVLSDYEMLPEPKRIVLLPQSTHLTGFTDVCRIGERDGGVVEITRRAGLELVTAALEQLLGDCATSPAAPPTAKLQAATAHYAAAALRDIFGLDRPPVGLDVRTARRFPGIDVGITKGPYRYPGSDQATAPSPPRPDPPT